MRVSNPPQPAAVPSHPLAPCEGVSLDRSQESFSSFVIRKDGEKSLIEARDRSRPPHGPLGFGTVCPLVSNS
jgi:hypothetical protein